MAKQSILLIDPHQRSISVMEPSLRKYGYEVKCATSRAQAESFMSLAPPDMIVMEVAIEDRSESDLSGVRFCEALKAQPNTAEIPVVFISSRDVHRARALSAGAEAFLTKPVYTGELKTVIEAALQRRQRVHLESAKGDRFFGRLEEMGLLDLLQIIDVSRRSGELLIEHRGQKGRLSFKDGELLDAEMAHLRGVEAIYRLLTWEFGQYEFDFNAPPTAKKISQSISEVKAEGVRRLDQWSHICEQLPSLDTVLRLDRGAVNDRGEPLSPEMVALMNLFDGRRTIREVIDASPQPDLTSLNALMEMYFEGLVNVVKERVAPREEEGFIDAPPSLPSVEAPTEAPTEALATPPLPPSQTPATQFGFDGLREFDMMGDDSMSEMSDPLDLLNEPPATPPLPDPMGDFMNELDQGLDQGFGALGGDLPPPVDELPPAVEAPPIPAAPAQEGGDEEGQELLAELYASIAGPMEPPPVPDASLTEAPSKADFDTFSFDNSYSFDEGEQDFFEAMSEGAEEPLEEEPPQTAHLKMSLVLILAFFVAVIAFFMRDRVTPIKMVVSTSDRAMWYADRLSARLLSPVDDLQAAWKIEREVDEELSPALAGVVSSAPEVKERVIKGSEKRRFDNLLKEALALYKSGGKENFRRAVTLADNALNLNPGHPHALMLSGVLHIEVESLNDAVQRLEQLMRINPAYADTRIDGRYQAGVLYVLLGSAYQGLDKKQRALKLYQQYIRDYPEGNQARDVRNLIENLR